MGVSGDAPTRAQMSTDRFGRNDADDRFMVAAAKLAFDLALPTEVAGTNVLTLPDREVTWARRLFEKAAGGFYDVVLDHAPSGRRIVIDTKFTSIVTSGWYRDETLRSGYVYGSAVRT